MTTLFDLPNSPEDFGVVLPSPELRRFDFSGLDYTTARKAIIEYIKTYFPDDFNDFVASNGVMMIMEIIAATTGKLALRSDMLANEAFLPTAQSEYAVVNHLALINQRIKRQTPAIVDVEVSIQQPSFTDIELDVGLQFNVSASPDGKPITYEIYRAPGDWTNKIIIPAGKRGIVAWGIEGKFSAPTSVISGGGPNQTFTVTDNNILESPIFVSVVVGNDVEEWKVISEPIERYGPNDAVVEVNFVENSAIFRFGDNITGRSPVSGSRISFEYRIGGGIRGRIGVGQIDITRSVKPLPPANAAIPVRFRNISPSSGGTDRESLEHAKRRAPRDFAVQRSIVTADDYAQAASSFSHPVYGAVCKAVATIRTSLNANLVEVYALVEGPDGIPVTPNAGLKAGLETYFRELNVLTDHVKVLDGAIKPVDIDIHVAVSKNADASVVKERVELAITNFFNINNWDMGQELYVSKIIELVEGVDGVAYVNLYKPVNNVLRTGELAAGGDGVGINEVIVEGERKAMYFYERSK